MQGLTTINLELTTRCNKECWMCGRRKREKTHSETYYKDMNFKLAKKIVKQIPAGTVVQLHNNGEGFLYPNIGEIARLLKRRRCITSITTNGKLLDSIKFDHVILTTNLNSIAISIFENDEEAEKQLETVKNFLELYKFYEKNFPIIVFRFIGDVDQKTKQEYYKLISYEHGYGSLYTFVFANRVLHDPEGSFNYKKNPTVPEIGICLEMLNHLAISYNGDVSPCVRFDPDKEFVIGNLNNNSLKSIWNGSNRKNLLDRHITGHRNSIPFCHKCDYWGIPTGN